MRLQSVAVILSPEAAHATHVVTTTVCFEKLANSYRVANLIREGKEHQIRALLSSGAEDFASLDIHLAQLVRGGKISRDDALHYCQDSKLLQELLARPGR